MSVAAVLLDVTAMSGDAVCVAGLNLDSGATIRLNDPQPTRALLRDLKGLVPGDVIQVDWRAARRIVPPHVEDGDWQPRSVKKLRTMELSELRERVAAGAFDSVESAFGTHLYRGKRGNHAWKPGEGARSLATLWVRYVRVEDRQDGVRMACRDDARAYWHSIPFQDLSVKIHWTQCEACGTEHIENVRKDFDANRTLVRIGLTRPFAPDEQQPAGCWLQVTNVFARPRSHF